MEIFYRIQLVNLKVKRTTKGQKEIREGNYLELNWAQHNKVDTLNETGLSRWRGLSFDKYKALLYLSSTFLGNQPTNFVIK